MRRLTFLFATAAITIAALLGAAPLPAQGTLGPVALSAGLGGGYQAHKEFDAIGFHVWGGAETVLDRRVRVRLDLGLHYFGYASPAIASCPRTTYCAPTPTSPLEVTAITGTVVWRDTTGVRRWYWNAGLGAYGTLGGRDGNSRLGLTAGLGRELGVARRWFVEARVHLPYDASGYGVIVPITAGWTFGHFTP